jgi:2-enoate reductase
MMKCVKLFELCRIGKLSIKNRIVMAPMGILGLVDRDGAPTQRAIDYYTERAFGGTGLIITGVTQPAELEPKDFQRLTVSRQTLPAFGELAESIHYYGSRLFVQLTAGMGCALHGSFIDQGTRPVSASAVPAYWRPDVLTKALEKEDLKKIIRIVSQAAGWLKAAGIDGVELHGHEGYLFDQFTTALWNKREDDYGKDVAGRLRFAGEVLQAIKKEAGADFPVVYRYGLKHYMKGAFTGALQHERFEEAGRDIEEGLEMARLLEKAGFDALHVDAGTFVSPYWPHPPPYQPDGCLVDLAEKVKRAVALPVIAVGKLGNPELAEKVLAEGKADLVALGRPLLADPHWPRKVREGRGEEIRPCTGCHDGCSYRMYGFKPLSCAVNPATGRERFYLPSYIPEVLARSQRVSIVGGGIAGMEAARVAAMRGHHVTLYEKGERLGGHLIAASVPDFKQDYQRLLAWYERELEKARIDIKLKTEVTSDLIRRGRPDRVIVATGLTPMIPDLPGIRKPQVATCIDLLLGRKRPGKHIAVIGGGLMGCETALWLVRQGHRVTLVEALPDMASGISHINKAMLLDMLKEQKVEILTHTPLKEVTDRGVVIQTGDSVRKTIVCDSVALAMGLRSSTEVYDSLKEEIVELYAIGDCKEPRKVMDALWEGYHVAAR